MKQMDFNRFKNLARWSLVMDRRWFVRSILSYLIVMVVMFLLYTCVINFDNKVDGLRPYMVCAAMMIIMAAAILVMGPTFMFVSMKGKHDDQVLLMLPASNLEKYLMRYSYWILMVPCLLATFVVADVLQYVVNLMLGHEWRAFVIQLFFSPDTHIHVGAGSLTEGLASLYVIVHLLWIHSVYAIGATLFRSHKYNWLYTSVVLILGFVLLLAAVNFSVDYSWGYRFGRWAARFLFDPASMIHYLWNGIVIILSAFNFWLSYKIFCRTQVKGKFINM